MTSAELVTQLTVIRQQFDVAAGQYRDLSVLRYESQGGLNIFLSGSMNEDGESSAIDELCRLSRELEPLLIEADPAYDVTHGAQPDGRILNWVFGQCVRDQILMQRGIDAQELAGNVFSAAATALGKLAARLQLAGEATPTKKDDSWVSAHAIGWQTHFATYKRFRAFLDKTPSIRQRKPRFNRLEIHAGDWLTFWAARDEADFKSLDGTPSPLTPDEITPEFLESAAERLAAVRKKKSSGK